MSIKDSLRSWRRNLKSRIPYVRQREHRILQRKYSELIDGLGWTAAPATQARLHAIKPIAQPLTGEVCLFVTFALHASVKRHVQTHIEHLQRCGVSVVLILNTDLPLDAFELDVRLLERLGGAFARENTGFDFAAWAHILSLCEGSDRWARLFLVNDSIVGPLNTLDFQRLVERIRASSADVVGLTESKSPLRHVQSFFLVFNATALRRQVVQRVFQRVLSLPTKSQVVDVYETQLTQVLTRHGLRCESLFPPLTDDPHSDNDTLLRWDRLIRAGFPFIKTSVLRELRDSAKVKALVPAEFVHPET